ncbi:MAG: ankyrin repeat domain-containing protein [Wolbachia sp.]
MVHEKDIRQLVEIGFNTNSKDANGITILHKFTKEGNAARVRSLLEHTVDFNVVDSENRKPLHYAAMYDIRKLLNFLSIS